MLERDEKIDLAGAADIILAGAVYKVPALPLRQTIALGPAIDKFNAIVAELKDAAPKGDQLLAYAEIAKIGLSAAYPRVTIDDVLGMPLTYLELLTAIRTVIGQSKFYKVLDPGELEAASQSTG